MMFGKWRGWKAEVGVEGEKIKIERKGENERV
jgi:hypothetical protein